ncbi:DUF1631 family protein [Porticoccus sp. W117]|uniref:DUF1631 family protein n=1 Tax=Porticoccus sp. W117 TaxID=3054777 RepID=UPI00259AE14F|nr:DUF1631 family protein [Porticoccus sp. W117]MDM3871064.1 DUF1631 family protein [Porticoccus sp. W117]
MTRHLHVVDSASNTARKRRPAELDPALQMLASKSVNFIADRLEVVFEQVDDTFFDLADNAENNQQQTVYFDAMRVLRMNRNSIEQECLKYVRSGFYESTLTSLLVAAAEESDADLDSMELMENDEVEQKVAFEVMVRRAEEHSKRGLQILCKRLDSLYGCQVNDTNNPLGGEAICRAFQQATEKVELDIRSRLVLLKLFERHVLSKLAELVQQGNQLLKELGVLPNIEQTKKRPTSRRRQTAATSQQIAGSGSQEAGGVLDKLSALIAQQQNSQQGTELLYSAESENYAPHEDLLAVIGQLHNNSSRVNADGDAQSLLDHIGQQLPQQLNLMDRTVVTLVDLLFQQACENKVVSPALNGAMKNLELAIAKIALQDGEFFDSEQHPARQLLNEVAQASMGFGENEEASNDPVYKKIHEVVEQLHQSDVESDQLPQLLDDFVSFVGREQRRSRAVEHRMLEEEDGRSRLNTSHTIVKQNLEQRLLGFELPGVVTSFVEQGWGKVLFLAHLREGELSGAWNDALQLLENIIAFAKPDGKVDDTVVAKEQDRKNLMEEIRLQLEKAAIDPYQIEFLAKGIERLIELRETGREQGKPDPKLVAKKVAALMLNIPGEPCKLPGDGDAKNLESRYLKQVDNLENGDWVELATGEDTTRRARFAGIVGADDEGKNGTLIFVNRRGTKVIQGSRQQLARAIKTQRLVVLDKQPLFDQAMETVLDNLQQNLQETKNIA